MSTKTGIMFVAGTCIGSGMIALPITLVKVGLIPSIIVMLSVWFIIYYTSLINLELNLQVGKSMTLGHLSKHFSGPKMQFIGQTLLYLLLYSLMSAYIALGSEVLEQIVGMNNLSLPYAFSLFFILLCPARIVKKINGLIFIGLISVIGLLIILLALSVDWSKVSLFERSELSLWSLVLPILFTSFGFQVIFHTLTDYYKGNKATLKQVFFWGSLLPAIVYIIWTASVIGAIENNSPGFYTKMVNEKVDVSELIVELSSITENKYVTDLIMWLSFLAIVTSAIGVGLGLIGSITQELNRLYHSHNIQSIVEEKQVKILPPALAVFPSLLIVILIPNAFISILAFAGMILSLIAIVIPIYLLSLVKGDLNYPELRNKFLTNLSLFVGCVIVICGIFNIL